MMNMTKITERSVRGVLAELGRSASQIHTSLKRRHIKGICKSRSSCPVAMFLRKRFPLQMVTITPEEVQVGVVEFEPSRAVARFIEGFDSGKFADRRG